MKTNINVRNFKHVERIEKFGKSFDMFVKKKLKKY